MASRRAKGKRRSFGRIERRASGRYRAGFTAPDGRLYRAPSTFDSKDDTIAWLAARRAEIQLNVWAGHRRAERRQEGGADVQGLREAMAQHP